MRVLKKPTPPEVVEKVSAIATATPSIRPVIAAVRGVQGSIKIPDRPQLQLALSALVHVSAQTKCINIHGQHIEHVMVDKGIDINVLSVPQFRIRKIRAIQRGFHLIEIPLDPGVLRLCQILTLGVHENEVTATACAERSIPCTINTEHITSRNSRLCTVPRLELLHVDTVGRTRNLLHADIETDIVTRGDHRIIGIEVHLTESRSNSIPPCLVAQFIGQRITNERQVVLRRPIQYPVGIRGKSENGYIQILVGRVPRFKGKLFLGKTTGRRPANPHPTASHIIHRACNVRTSIGLCVNKRRLDQFQGARDILPSCVHNNDGQIRAERSDLTGQGHKGTVDRRTGQHIGLVCANHDLGTSVNQHGPRVLGRTHTSTTCLDRIATVERVIDFCVGRGTAQL